MYCSDGTARNPGTSRLAPPSCTGRALLCACACPGSWQVAHAIAPDAERLGSAKIFSPSVTGVGPPGSAAPANTGARSTGVASAQRTTIAVDATARNDGFQAARGVAEACRFILSLPYPALLGAGVRLRRHTTGAGLPSGPKGRGGWLAGATLLGEDQLAESCLAQEVGRLLVEDRELRGSREQTVAGDDSWRATLALTAGQWRRRIAGDFSGGRSAVSHDDPFAIADSSRGRPCRSARSASPASRCDLLRMP